MDANPLPAPPTDDPSGYLTTREAAAQLGVSVGTVHNLVERGHLEAWRTGGGHRRIIRASVMAQLERRQRYRAAHAGAARPPLLDVLVIEDDKFLQVVYRDQLGDWNLPLQLRFADNGVDGLIELGVAIPHVLLLDLGMPVMDGFSVLRTLRGRAGFDAMDIIAITGLDAESIASRGGLPPGIVVWPKPVPFEQLRGYLEARLVSLQRAGAP